MSGNEMVERPSKAIHSDWQRKGSPAARGAEPEVLRHLVRLLARQTARDWLAGFSHRADQTQQEEVIDDQA